MHICSNIHNVYISQLVIIIYLFNTHRLRICACSLPAIATGSISMDSVNPGSGSESVDTGQLYILMKETEEDTDK